MQGQRINKILMKEMSLRSGIELLRKIRRLKRRMNVNWNNILR